MHRLRRQRKSSTCTFEFKDNVSKPSVNLCASQNLEIILFKHNAWMLIESSELDFVWLQNDVAHQPERTLHSHLLTSQVQQVQSFLYFTINIMDSIWKIGIVLLIFWCILSDCLADKESDTDVISASYIMKTKQVDVRNQMTSSETKANSIPRRKRRCHRLRRRLRRRCRRISRIYDS